MKKAKAIVFIDGSNFYFRLKELTKNLKNIHLLNFQYRQFCKWLCKNFDIIEIRYYIGVIKEKENLKSKKLFKNQQKLFKKLQKNKVKLIEGQLIQHSDKTYHEKGVDVKLAIDMAKLARLNKYDTAFLLSSDTDLIPAIEEVFSFNKKVKYICTKNRRSFALSKITGDFLILREKNIKNFF